MHSKRFYSGDGYWIEAKCDETTERTLGTDFVTGGVHDYYSHIAIQEQLHGKTVDWMEKVSDEQYHAASSAE